MKKRRVKAKQSKKERGGGKNEKSKSRGLHETRRAKEGNRKEMLCKGRKMTCGREGKGRNKSNKKRKTRGGGRCRRRLGGREKRREKGERRPEDRRVEAGRGSGVDKDRYERDRELDGTQTATDGSERRVPAPSLPPRPLPFPNQTSGVTPGLFLPTGRESLNFPLSSLILPSAVAKSSFERRLSSGCDDDEEAVEGRFEPAGRAMKVGRADRVCMEATCLW
ncbi:hypothetical protein BDY24DRAFT_401334 [Mrakia frigida]|uniref:uncharacterized protein n=1 Tax=Mrakia frigida TaxID=29902 RepID=UPI003FCC2294